MPRARRQRKQLALPTTVGSASTELAFEATSYKLDAILSEGGPEPATGQQMVQLLSSHVVVLDVSFLHEQELQACWGKGQPAFGAPGVQLVGEAELARTVAERVQQGRGCGTSAEKCLQCEVLGGALNAAAVDMA